MGSFCAFAELNFFGEVDVGFACLSPGDECLTDADCKSLDTGSGLPHVCMQADDHRRCSLPPE